MDKGIKSYSDLLRNILKLKTYPVGLKICEWFISDTELCFAFPEQDMNSIITVLEGFQN